MLRIYVDIIEVRCGHSAIIDVIDATEDRKFFCEDCEFSAYYSGYCFALTRQHRYEKDAPYYLFEIREEAEEVM